MDKRGLIFTVLTVVLVHFFVLVLVLLPGCSSTESHRETDAAASRLSASSDDTDRDRTAASDVYDTEAGNTQDQAGSGKKNTVRKYYPIAGRPRPFYAAGAVNGKILDLQNWSKKNPKNYSRVCGILIDMNSRKILWQLNPEKQVPIASLTKIMSLLVAYEALQQRTCPLSLDSEIEITPEARKVPPSGVAFRPAEKSFPLEKLMIAAAVKSANDATYLIAQAFGKGSAANFVEAMNNRARELGMHNTKYYNPHGLPGRYEGKPDNVSTVRDLANLCEAYLTYPDLHKWSSTVVASFRAKNDLYSHNNLLIKGKFHTRGVSGIKTGYTINAGLCLAAVCDRNGRRLLAIVTGFNNTADRDRFTKNLLEWGYKQ